MELKCQDRNALTIDYDMFRSRRKSVCDVALAENIRQRSYSVYHPCGTCRIGSDPRDAVVNPRLRVHGIRDSWSSTPRTFPPFHQATSTPLRLWSVPKVPIRCCRMQGIVTSTYTTSITMPRLAAKRCSARRRGRATGAAYTLAVHQDVDEPPKRVAHIDAAHPPWFIGGAIFDRDLGFLYAPQGGVEIIDFDREIGHRRT